MAVGRGRGAWMPRRVGITHPHRVARALEARTARPRSLTRVPHAASTTESHPSPVNPHSPSHHPKTSPFALIFSSVILERDLLAPLCT